MNDTNENIYSLFKGVVLNETMLGGGLPPVPRAVTADELKRKWFKTNITITKIKHCHEQNTYKWWYDIYFNPIKLSFPDEEVRTTEGEAWSQVEIEYRPRDPAEISKAFYRSPMDAGQRKQLNNMLTNFRFDQQANMMLPKAGPITKKVAFEIEFKIIKEREVPIVRQISTLLSR